MGTSMEPAYWNHPVIARLSESGVASKGATADRPVTGGSRLRNARGHPVSNALETRLRIGLEEM